MIHFDVNVITQFIYACSACLFSFITIVYVRNMLAEITNNIAYKVLGIVGVPIHELSHLTTALLFNHKIVDFQLFKPSRDGSLGYVLHSYNPSLFSPIANMLIGIAPLFGGTLAFIGVTKWLRPDVFDYFATYIELSNVLNGDLSGFLSKLTSMLDIILFSSTNVYLTVLWVFVSYSLVVYSVPSKADFSQSKIGLLLIIVIILLLSMLMPSFLESIGGLISSLSAIWIAIALLHLVILLVTFMAVFVTRLIFQSGNRP